MMWKQKTRMKFGWDIQENAYLEVEECAKQDEAGIGRGQITEDLICPANGPDFSLW